MIWAVLILAGIIAIPLFVERGRRQMDDVARGAAPGRFVELSQGVTHYAWHGPLRGPVAVCVHGLTTPSFVWRGLAPGLALLGFRVLTYDLYGRGFSDRPAGPQDRAFFDRQLVDLLADQGIEDDITIVGYSMGGAIATCFAATHPGRLRQLILLAPAGMQMVSGRLTQFIIDTPLIGDWLKLAFYPWHLRRGIRAEARTPGAVPEIDTLKLAELDFRGFVPAVLASRRGLLSQTLRDEHKVLHREGIPVLAIWGRADTVIPITALGKLAEWNRSAHQEVIEDAGHGLTYTHADAVIEVLRAHVRGR